MAAAEPEVGTIRRDDGVGGTLLRKVPTHSREAEVFLSPQKEVMEGEAVTVLRREGEFAWVRAEDGVEGFLKSCYLRIHELSAATMTRHGVDGVGGTLLRKVPTHSREQHVFLPKEVKEGEAVTILWRTNEFAWVRAEDGVEGFLKSCYLRIHELSSATVKRDDGVGGTLLRKVPTHSREAEVFLSPHKEVADCEPVTVLWRTGEFTWVQTGDGVEGFVKSEYLKVHELRPATMRRDDGVRGTLLRKVPTHSREQHVFLPKEVKEGEAVTILWRTNEFAWVRAEDGVEGFLKSTYCRIADGEQCSKYESHKSHGRSHDSLGLPPAKVAAVPSGLAAAGETGLQKFFAAPNQLKLGHGADAAHGLNKWMGLTDNQISKFLKMHERAIMDEFSQNGDAEDGKNLQAVLNGTKRSDWESGISIAELMAHPDVIMARLQRHHVIALRLYTTSSYSKINDPLRAEPPIRPPPFAATTFFISDGIKMLRAVAAQLEDAHTEKIFWRGLRDVGISKEFQATGGTDYACVSTTASQEVAVKFAGSSLPLAFKFVSKTFMNRGADIAFLSVYTSEQEYLYPPLTYMRCDKVETETVCGKEVVVATVEPIFS